MSKVITVKYEIEDDDFNEIMKHDLVQGELGDFFNCVLDNYFEGTMLIAFLIEDVTDE